METPTHCTLCPRRCGADRTRTHGLCGGGGMVKIARAALHFWEEPCISGTQGSGTVFFSGCPLQCCYCQNHGISAGNFGDIHPAPGGYFSGASGARRTQHQPCHGGALPALGMRGTRYGPARAAYPGGIQYRRL